MRDKKGGGDTPSHSCLLPLASCPPKAALITGGAKRLGRAIALHLAAQGWDIALHYHTSVAEAEATAAEIRALGRVCTLHAADLADVNAFAPLVQEVRAALPHCRHLVNSASTFERGPFMESDAAAFERDMAVNLRAPVLLTQAFVRLHTPSPCKGEGRGGGPTPPDASGNKECRRESGPPPDLPLKGGGKENTLSIVNLLDSKITADRHSYFFYLLAKKALAEFTRMSAAELAPHVRVNAVCPGSVMPSSDGRTGEEYLRKVQQNLPLKRLATPEDIAKAVRFLLEADGVTGQFLFVDGGESLRG